MHSNAKATMATGQNPCHLQACRLQVLLKWQGAKLSIVRRAARELPAAADSSCTHLSSLPPAHLKTGHRSTPAGPAAVPTANSSTLPVKLRSLRPAAQVSWSVSILTSLKGSQQATVRCRDMHDSQPCSKGSTDIFHSPTTCSASQPTAAACWEARARQPAQEQADAALLWLAVW